MDEPTPQEFRRVIDGLKQDLADAETRRALAQGKADNYLLELQRVRDARAKGRRANRKLRDQVVELQARIYRLTNRGTAAQA